MDTIEVEENLFAAGDAKLHGDMCSALSATYCRVLSIFPTLEASRPRSKTGIKALCSLHLALEKAKNILQHCSESSKLYLAITGDSVVMKFERAKSALKDSLRRVEDIVPDSIGGQLLDIIGELESTSFSLDPLEKEVGDQLISLLQHGGRFDNSNANELETFHQAAVRLGITSSRAALVERRSLKKLIDRARMEDDKRKESIVAYLLHLMRKYSKLFRSEVSDDNDSQGSMPCSPTVQGSVEDGVFGGYCRAFDRQLSKLSSFNFKSTNRRSWHMPVAPEELRCPISLQLMYDPVIIASGQTYERICIEKWFSDGHSTCPKTHQQLSHLFLTPNYCVKGLVASWCEQNGVPIPDGPPESLDLNYWRLALSESESNARSVASVNSYNTKEVKVVPIEENVTIEEETNEAEICTEEDAVDMLQFHDELLRMLNERGGWRKKCGVVERIRLLLRDDAEARSIMGENGFVAALMHFLENAIDEHNFKAQEIGALALFNLAVDNNRNKELMLNSGIISILEKMIVNSRFQVSATALYLNLSCLEEAKPVIGASHAVAFLVNLLEIETEQQCKLDALHTLYNLSTYSPNTPNLLSCGIIRVLQTLMLVEDHAWTEKSLAILLNLAADQAGREEMVSTLGLISSLATVLDTGEQIEQEQSVACLMVLCDGNEGCSQMVLQEGVIPSLVSISVNGTARGRDKAQKLLLLFREQRQRNQAPSNAELHTQKADDESLGSRTEPSSGSGTESKPHCKPIPRRKMGRAFSFFWRNSKSFSVYQC